MGYSYINRTERLARWICKSLKPGAEIEMEEVHGLVAQIYGRRAHASQTWRQQVRIEAVGIPEAVQLALSNGWLVERDGRLGITDAGAALARRSRAAPRKKRGGALIP
jgi:hypothetical protein